MASSMELEETFAIAWEQLPQRKLWTQKERRARSAAAAPTPLSVDQTGAPYAATTPAHPQPGTWEYLDHTADVQIHSMADNLNDAFGAVVVGMFGYMVKLEQIGNDMEMKIAIHSHDLQSLLYNFMDECLYLFYTQQFVAKQVIVTNMDRQNWKLTAIIRGGMFEAGKHAQGTEVKAITYSNMQIIEEEGNAQTFVIVDI